MAGSVDMKPDEARLAQAAAWRMRLAEDGAASQEGFEAWLASDRANTAAWEAVQAPWRDIGEAATSPELLALRRDALERARRQARARWSAAPPRRAVAAGVLVLAAAALGGGAWIFSRPDVYETRRGERRTVTLEDGSRVALDSATRLEVRMSSTARRLELAAGQARFDVAKDAARPFSVRAGGQMVIATGTSFNVDRLGDRVLVTLIEGSVVVQPAAPASGAAAAAVRLRAGERLASVARPGSGPPKVEPVTLDKALAWERGQLVFEDEPLSAVVERVSRYTPKPVVVKDPSIATLRISGVFQAGDLATFVDTVSAYLPVRGELGANGETELLARS